MKNSKILKINTTIRCILDKQKQNKLRSIQNNTVYSLRSLFINNILSDESFKQSEYRNIFINYMLNAERLIKGGSYLLLSLYYKSYYNIEIESKLLENKIDSLDTMLNIMSSSQASSNTIKNIINFSGPDGSISCQKNNNDKIEVTKKIESKIKVNICEEFRNIYFSKQKCITKNFIIACMDAYIERESEISPLINKAIDNKQNVLIFARGYSENFKRNIKNIISKSKVFIYPYLVKFDNEDPFLLKDISRCLETQIYSAEAGDNIANTLLDKSSVKSVKVSSNNITIIEQNKSLIDEINLAIKNSDDRSLTEYLLKRKKRVSTNSTEVLIPNNHQQLFEEIKNAIHSYNNCAISGFVDYESYVYPKNIFNKILILSKNLHKVLDNISVVVKIKDLENV